MREHSSNRNPFKEAFLAGAICLIVSAGVLGAVYAQARLALVDNLRSHLEDLADIAAAQMDAALHASLTRPEQMETEAYRQACAPLLRLRSAVPEIYYAYSVAMKNGALVFVLDTSYFIKNNGDQTVVAKTGDEYADAPDALRAVWKVKRAMSSAEPYTDKWGTFLSGFSPFKDKAGRVVGVVGVDLSLEEFNARFRPLHWALGIAACLGLFGSALVSVASYRGQSRRFRFEEEQSRLIETAKAAASAAQAADRAKGVFLATMSHEIRTPLNTVIGMTEILSGLAMSPEQEEYVNTIRQSGELLLAVINDILDYSKIEAGAVVIVAKTVMLRSCVEETVDLFAIQASRKGLTLGVEWTADTAYPVMGDHGRVRQILANLVGNAVKFTENGGVVLKVEAAEIKGRPAVAVTVCDTGIGIPEERLRRLFVPFSQVDDSPSRSQGGTGLGLAISRRLAGLMNGDLTVESEMGRGSRFRLVLPSSQAAGEAAVVAPSPAGQNALVARRILVAEDMPGNRRVVGLMLQRLGQTPRFAENGEAAVLSWREHRQEIILMDVNMPGVDGREATRRIRAESGDMQRPWIIAVTAGAMSEERDAALAAGMNDFITKPITGEMLAGALRRAPAADTAG